MIKWQLNAADTDRLYNAAQAICRMDGVRSELDRTDIAAAIVLRINNDCGLLDRCTLRMLVRRYRSALARKASRRARIASTIVLGRVESVREFDRLDADLPETLTGRERKVCHLLADGCSQHDIAEQMDCSQSVISGVVKSIREKF